MDNDLRLCGIPARHIDYIWDLILHMISDAVEYSYGKYTVQDIYNALCERDMQLWVIVDNDDIPHAIIVTQIIYYPSKKVMLFVLAAGVKFDNWTHLLPQFIAFAKDHQCTAMEFYGRTGWEKKIEPLGFKKIHTVFSLNINGEYH
jgi:hypothetical protein